MLTYIKKLFGSKSDRDIKEITPLLAAIHKAYESISKLSTDELRAKTQEFKNRIEAYISAEKNQIDELKEKIESEDLAEIVNVDEKEKMYQQIDQLEKVIVKKVEEILLKFLLKAFPVFK